MKRLAWLTFGFLVVCLILVGCGGSGNDGDDGDGDINRGLRMGLLQFRTQHNLQDSTCLPAGRLLFYDG